MINVLLTNKIHILHIKLIQILSKGPLKLFPKKLFVLIAKCSKHCIFVKSITIIIFLRFHLFIFRQRGREGAREG